MAFRFAFLVGVLQLFPLAFGTVPGTGWLVSMVWKLWEWGVAWVARTLLAIPEPPHVFTGSSDSTWHYVQLLLVAMVATAGTIVWSVVDRRRLTYTRLAAVAHVVLRYYLAVALLTYGLAKVFEVQFVTLAPFRLDERVGDMSPMGMLWSFMGASRPYTVFVGLLELVAALLLLWRRTAMLGALVAIAAMINVVMLNFCYDVAVKLFSLRLLAYAITIALPQAARLLRAALGYTVPDLPPRPRSTPRRELLRRLAKLALVGSVAIVLVRHMWMVQRGLPKATPLDGIWVVESFAIDGVDRPPLLTDSLRWRKLIVSPAQVTVRSMTDERTHHPAWVDASVIHVLVGDHRHTWRYRRVANLMVLAGRYHDRELHVVLGREPEPLLKARGFHWVNDEPMYR